VNLKPERASGVEHLRVFQVLCVRERMSVFEKRQKELCLFRYSTCGAVQRDLFKDCYQNLEMP